MNNLDPEQVWTAVAAVLFLEAGFSLGIAFLIRGMRESSGGAYDD